MSRRFQALSIAFLLFLVLATAPPAARAAAYPLQASPDGRYLVDQDDVPFLIVGESPQAMMVNVTEAEAEMFFANRAGHGFNTCWINLLCATYTGGRPDGSTLDGVRPFLANLPGGAPDLTTPNEIYFAHVDRVLAIAAAHGIQILLDPCETGSYLSVMLDNGLARCRAYGQYLGARYGAVDNIIWMSGNDFQGWRDSGNDAVVREVALGILDDDTRHLHTVELDYPVSSSLDDAAWDAILGLNATYTYYPTYARLRQDYNRPNFRPNFLVEANYEFESLQGPVTTAPILRKQEYWTMTSGAAGQMYGNGYTWPFLGGWQSQLDTPGAVQIGLMKTFFEPRAWYQLVPDTTHVVVTAGYGTYADVGYVDDNDFLTAARTPGGDLVVIYTPILRTFTVDLGQLGGPATTRWFDPSDGDYVTVAGSPLPPSGLRAFTPPGPNADGDGGWVLVLETQPPETVPPVVTLTSPAPGAVVGGEVAIAATASDNVGVVGVRFRIDGNDLGGEDTAPPYATTWNSALVVNGPHEITAIARDLAGNRGQDAVSVTVHNVFPPPPADHLALAYAFDETGGGTIADVSGNANSGTLHGATFAPGHHGNGLAFDGLADYAEAPNSASLDIGGTGITIAFWTNVVSTTSGIDYVLVGKPWSASSMPSPFYQYGVEYANAGTKTLDFYFGDPSAGLHGPYRMNPTAGVWTHCAFTYDGSTVKGYLDGIERLSVPDVSSLQPRGHSLRLGVDGAYHQFFNGTLDDLRIYSRALTAAEVRSAMQIPVGGGAVAVQPGPDGAVALMLTSANPNPSPGSTSFAFTLPATLPATLRVYDVAGRQIRTLVDGVLTSGPHAATWDGRDAQGRAVPSGRYFARLMAGGTARTSPVLLVR